MTDERERLIHELGLNPPLAHATFFSHRHKNKDAPFHRQMELDFHSDIPNILWLIFRGSAKSTKFEEGAALEIGFQRIHNLLILGESEIRAVERLAAIKHIIEYDENFQTVFQIEPGDPWQDTKAVTSTGIMMQAAGRGQSLRGVKYLQERPDFILLDDVEDKESGSVATAEARRKTRGWLTGTVIPALVPGGRMRMAATPIHPEALAPTLANAEDSGWVHRTVPIIYRGEQGEWVPSWPDRYPLEWVMKKWNSYRAIGQEEDFAQEFLCQAVDPGSQTFTEDMFVVEPRVRSWHPVYAVYDPARTTNRQSATTGKAVASWIGSKLIVWEADARKWMPDEIIDDIVATNERYKPICVGVEETGLNEWLMQPIRARMAETGVLIPLRALQAPRGKLDFIRSLQPYFRAKEILFATEMPELRKQLLGFPTGHIDAPNALAYMLRLKMGIPIYDNFREEMIDERASIVSKAPAWILLNSNNQITTGILAQHHGGSLRILWDLILDGDPGTVLSDLLAEAGQQVGKDLSKVRFLASQKHFDEYSLYGLKAAISKLGLGLARGGDAGVGREELRSLMRRSAHGRTALLVNPDASWTLRALAGGFARDVDKTGPLDNAYAVLIEPLESFAAWLRVGGSNNLDTKARFEYTSDGRRYISALARR